MEDQKIQKAIVRFFRSPKRWLAMWLFKKWVRQFAVQKMISEVDMMHEGDKIVPYIYKEMARDLAQELLKQGFIEFTEENDYRVDARRFQAKFYGIKFNGRKTEDTKTK